MPRRVPAHSHSRREPRLPGGRVRVTQDRPREGQGDADAARDGMGDGVERGPDHPAALRRRNGGGGGRGGGDLRRRHHHPPSEPRAPALSTAAEGVVSERDRIFDAGFRGYPLARGLSGIIALEVVVLLLAAPQGPLAGCCEAVGLPRQWYSLLGRRRHCARPGSQQPDRHLAPGHWASLLAMVRCSPAQCSAPCHQAQGEIGEVPHRRLVAALRRL